MRFWIAGAMILAGLGSGCRSMDVTDLASWCEHVENVARDNADYSIFSLDRQAVRESLVSEWDKILVENGAEVLGVPRDSIGTDAVIEELRDTKFVGAWATADTLHFALTIFPSPIRGSGRSDSRIFAQLYEERLIAAREADILDAEDAMSYCLSSGIDHFFAGLVIHHSSEEGSPERSSIRTEVFHRLQEYADR